MTAALDMMTEAEWQGQVVDLAHMHGWHHLHIRRSIGKGRRWQTTTNVVGFPDLLLWHPRHGFAAIELKSESGKPTDEQVAVLATLEAAGAAVLVARPSDLEAVLDVLRGVTLTERTPQ